MQDLTDPTGAKVLVRELEVRRDRNQSAAASILEHAKADKRSKLTENEDAKFRELIANRDALNERIAHLDAEIERSGAYNPELHRIKGGQGGAGQGSAGHAKRWAQETARLFWRSRGEARAVVSGSLDVPALVEATVNTPPHPARLIDLFPNRIAVTENSFTFYQQIARVNAATAVADLATKPTSTLTTRAVEDRCRVVAHLSDEVPVRLLYDIESFEAWLASEMVQGVWDGLEGQIVAGTGSGENMLGLLHTSGITSVDFTTDVITSLRDGLTQLQLLGEQPSGWALHPADAARIDLLRWDNGVGDTGGLLIDGYQSPTNTMYGTSSNIFGSGIPRVISNSVPEGQAILGDFRQLRIYVRQDAHVDIDAGGELFTKNAFIMRGEGRFGIGVLRPQSFAVIALGPTEFIVSLGSPSAGTFTLTYGGRTTSAIAYNASAATVKNALVALDDGWAASDWVVTGSNGGPFTVVTPGGPLTGSGAGLTDGTFSIAPA